MRLAAESRVFGPLFAPAGAPTLAWRLLGRHPRDI